jgi:signal transduction histidine kinase
MRATVSRVSIQGVAQYLAPSAVLFPDLSGLSGADSAKTDFFSAAIHELKTPLTTVSLQIQRARKLMIGDSARGRAAMDLALQQLARVDRHIADLQDAIRLRSNAMSLEVVTLDLRDAVAEAIIRHEPEETPRVRFDRPVVGAYVRVDPERLAQILDNLLSNALKYSSASSPIDIAVKIAGDEVHVRVQDHGVGVPADDRDRLFAPYFRTRRTRDIHGSGLGLHISRGLAEQHGGRLWLDHAGDEGSTFALALPLAG